MKDRTQGPRFSPALLDEIRRRISLVAFIGRRVRLTAKGGNKHGIGLCPFHNEKTPSFHVYDEGADSHYHCFGCGAHGDAFTYVMQIRGVDFAESVAELCAECGLEDQLGPEGTKIRRSASQAKEDRARRDAEEKAARERQAAAEQRRKDGGSALALEWWRKGVRPAGTVVQSYLGWRGVPLDPMPRCIRYCAAVPQTFDRRAPERGIFWDTMLLGIQDPAGEVRALHISYLTPDGRNAQPMQLGGDDLLPEAEARRLGRESRIKVFREIRGLTQQQLGAAIGTDARHVAGLERNEDHLSSIEQLQRLAAALDMPLETSPKRRMIGPAWGGAVRLTPFQPGKPLYIGEGFETVASVMLDLDTNPEAEMPGTFWAALSMNNMAGSGDASKQQRAPFHPTRVLKDPKTGEPSKRRARLPTEYPDMGRPGILVPAGVTEIVQLCDGDSDPFDTRAMMHRATRRHQARGLVVRNAWADRGMDFNDMRGQRLGAGFWLEKVARDSKSDAPLLPSNNPAGEAADHGGV